MSESFKQEALPPSSDQQNRQLREEIDEVYRANERLANDYDAAELRIRELEALLERLNAERDDLQRKVHEDHRIATEGLTSRIQHLESVNAELSNSLQQRSNEVAALAGQFDRSRSELYSVNASHEQLSARLDQVELEYSESQQIFAALKDEKQQLAEDVNELGRELEKRTEELRETTSTIISLQKSVDSANLAAEARVIELDSLRQQLEKAGAELAETTARQKSESEIHAEKLQNLSAENAALQRQFDDTKRESQSMRDALSTQHSEVELLKSENRRLADRESHVVAESEKIETESQGLRLAIQSLTSQLDTTKQERDSAAEEIERLRHSNTELSQSLELHQAEIKRRDEERGERAQRYEFLVKELGDAKSDVASLREQLEQAASKTESTSKKQSSRSRSVKPAGRSRLQGKRKRDLTLIEGIGPKIRDLLNAEGIITFDQLAETKVIAIEKILSNAGSHFSSHNPETWPEQAKLAAKDCWDELEQLQLELKGGRRIT